MVRQHRARCSVALVATTVTLCCLRAAAAASVEHTDQQRVPFTANKRAAGPMKGISPWAQNVVLGSLALTVLAVFAHMLRSKASSAPATIGAVADATAGAGAGAGVTGVGGAAGAGAGTVTGAAASNSAKVPQMVDGSEGAKPPSLPLHKLIAAGDTAAVLEFVKQQPPALVAELFNHGDPALNGTTPLLLSIRLGKTEISEVLLKGGAELSKPGAWGLTPLMYAAVYRRVRVAAAILELGGKDVELQARDAHGHSCLDHAMGEGSREVEALLLAHAKKHR